MLLTLNRALDPKTLLFLPRSPSWDLPRASSKRDRLGGKNMKIIPTNLDIYIFLISILGSSACILYEQLEKTEK